MMIELHDLLERLRDDTDVRVLLFSSSHEEFFLAHVDMGIFEHLKELEPVAARFPQVNVHQASASSCAPSRRSASSSCRASPAPGARSS